MKLIRFIAEYNRIILLHLDLNSFFLLTMDAPRLLLKINRDGNLRLRFVGMVKVTMKFPRGDRRWGPDDLLVMRWKSFRRRGGGGRAMIRESIRLVMQRNGRNRLRVEKF